jgi:hypothetical protein
MIVALHVKYYDPHSPTKSHTYSHSSYVTILEVIPLKIYPLFINYDIKKNIAEPLKLVHFDWLGGYDAMMSWLRLLRPADCIPLSHYIYIKCFTTLICCGKAHECGLTLILQLTVGPDFGNSG